MGDDEIPTIVITLKDGVVNVNGCIHDTLLSLGLLGMAKMIVEDKARVIRDADKNVMPSVPVLPEIVKP